MNKLQIDIVSNKLMKGKTVDTVWAVNNGILRLSSIIHRLKGRGYKIESVPVIKNKKLQKYSGYRLVEEIPY